MDSNDNKISNNDLDSFALGNMKVQDAIGSSIGLYENTGIRTMQETLSKSIGLYENSGIRTMQEALSKSIGLYENSGIRTMQETLRNSIGLYNNNGIRTMQEMLSKSIGLYESDGLRTMREIVSKSIGQYENSGIRTMREMVNNSIGQYEANGIKTMQNMLNKSIGQWNFNSLNSSAFYEKMGGLLSTQSDIIGRVATMPLMFKNVGLYTNSLNTLGGISAKLFDQGLAQNLDEDFFSDAENATSELSEITLAALQQSSTSEETIDQLISFFQKIQFLLFRGDAQTLLSIWLGIVGLMVGVYPYLSQKTLIIEQNFT